MSAAVGSPTDAEVEAAVDVLTRAGWSVTTTRLNGHLAPSGQFVLTDRSPIPGWHEPHQSRRAVEPYRPADVARAAS